MISVSFSPTHTGLFINFLIKQSRSLRGVIGNMVNHVGYAGFLDLNANYFCASTNKVEWVQNQEVEIKMKANIYCKKINNLKL